jgi:8-oxo-dGTP pyrophosphatase MutT (NUDIX family)
MSRDEAIRLSAGVVVVRRAPTGWLFLMLRAYRNWDFPKGMVESGETPLDAARREVLEETSIDRLDFTWGTDFKETVRYAGNKVARYYIAQTGVEAVTLPINQDLGRPEHDEWQWLTYEATLARASARLLPVASWAGRVLQVDRA